MPELRRSLGFLYLQETKLRRETIGQQPRPRILPADPFKRYPMAEKVPLPRDWEAIGGDLWSALRTRRSVRQYGSGAIGMGELACLLWAAQGVTARSGPFHLRTAPSAGALYPVETYVAAERVAGLPPGLMHLDVQGFQLERLTSGPSCRDVSRAALGQAFLGEAAAVFIWSAVLRRTMTKYGHRGLRYIFMDAGHVCQNLLLAAEALGLGACPVAALFDDEMNAVLGLDAEEETVIYAASVGNRKREK